MIYNTQVSPLAADLDHILSHTEKLWGKLRGHAVFITGGTGFFGRWLLESFSEANRRFELGAQAVVLSRDPDRFHASAPLLAEDDSIAVVEGDVCDFDAHAIRAKLGSPPNPFTHVIHGASESGEATNQNQPLAVLEMLFEGTRNTLNFAFQTDAKNFLLISSGAVYGEQPSYLTHIPETYNGAPEPGSPLSAYGEGKRMAESLCHAYARRNELHLKIARCFAFVGPYLDMDAHYAIGNFMGSALHGKPIRIKGDGTLFRSYLYAADVAVWLWTLLLNPAASGAYNVGSDDAVSIRQVADCVSRHSPHQSPVVVARKPDPNQPAARYVPNIKRARTKLRLDTWTSLDVAVQKTLEFHQFNQNESP